MVHTITQGASAWREAVDFAPTIAGMWIDTHCHLDAPEWHALGPACVRQEAARAGVSRCVLPAVQRSNWDAVRLLARAHGDAYALGIHPLYVLDAEDDDLDRLDQALSEHRADPRLVAVGEIGLDFFVPALCTDKARARQQRCYLAQLALARKHGLPVILHVRRSADELLKGLRQQPVIGGVAHAFNGSLQQADRFLERGFALGFGGAVTFEAARRLRALAQTLPDHALVLETDAPDIPPQWLYVNAARRAQGETQMPNSPAQLPRIGQVVAELRGVSASTLATITYANALRVLPGLKVLDGQQHA